MATKRLIAKLGSASDGTKTLTISNPKNGVAKQDFDSFLSDYNDAYGSEFELSALYYENVSQEQIFPVV